MLKRKDLLTAYTASLLILIIMMVLPILLAIFAKNVLHTSVNQYNYLQIAFALGVIFGCLLNPYLAKRIGMNIILLVETLTLALFLYAFSHLSSIKLAICIYLLIGFCLSIWSLMISKAQLLTDIDYQGRVQSSFNVLASSLMVIIYMLLCVNHSIAIRSWYYLNIILSVGVIILLYIEFSNKSNVLE